MRAIVLALVLVSGTAHAQANAKATGPGLPPVGWVDLSTLGGDSRRGFGTTGDALDVLAMQPLRLGLTTGYVPQRLGDSLLPNCRDAPAYAGAATGMSAFPGQQAIGLRVFGPPPSWSERRALAAPRLTLFGMSRIGCAPESAMGGGATLTVGLTKDTFFVLSGGAIFLPQAVDAPKHEIQARADVVMKGDNGRAYSVGVGYHNGGPHVGVGGVW